MPLHAATTVREALEPLCIRDPDYEPLSPSHLQYLFRQDTMEGLRSRLSDLMVIQCEGEHDDPDSCRTRVNCPLRELNLACGHQDFTMRYSQGKRQQEWKTPLAAILTACNVLAGSPHRQRADQLMSEARSIADQLYVADAGAYLSYHRLRRGVIFTREDLVGFPHAAWTHPFASIQNIPELKSRIASFQSEHGSRLEAIRDELLQLMESVAGFVETSASVVV